MEELVQQIDLAALVASVAAYTPRVIGGLVIIVSGGMIAGWLSRMTRRAFDAKGISIPFPQRDVHVHQSKASVPDLHTVA